ncbi:hypothetical protein [Caulobacter sp. RL271]|uniref:DUF1579 domain-containing protein n=1 Tax=Caulobacter segnis TaxID=88688 RepID=A0ABY4ZU78_9CAUL|nr:hypothetical protein [Caulobacter segnis]USQ96362.1 hypothetical protein MZV50_01830 [Caulobacter segnis]
MRVSSVSALLLAMAGAARAEDPPPAPVPAEVKALEGCWRGAGEVMGKAVEISLSARPAALGTLLTVDADSHAKADPADRYAAHLVLAGRGVPPKDGPPIGVSGFWADSFGGDFTATGKGEVQPGGFDIAYAYPDASFVNRWRRDGDTLTWTIVAKMGGKENAFAGYALTRTTCARG